MGRHKKIDLSSLETMSAVTPDLLDTPESPEKEGIKPEVTTPQKPALQAGCVRIRLTKKGAEFGVIEVQDGLLPNIYRRLDLYACRVVTIGFGPDVEKHLKYGNIEVVE